LIPEKTMVDEKALKILLNTYWSSNGWKPEFIISPDDFTYAQKAGVMFEPVKLTHDETIAWLRSSLQKVKLEDVSNAFLVSLRTRQLELRSALGSFAIAKNFPDHRYQDGRYCCSVCGCLNVTPQTCDLSRLNFERFKWGGVLHFQPEFMAFDLEQFTKIEKIVPSEQDIDVLRQIIQIISQCKPSDKPRDLEKMLASVIKSNKAERENLIQTLAYCGILQPHNRPGYFDSYPNYFERADPPVNKIDWTYPVCWWSGKDGINQNALNYYFPYLSC